MRIPQRPQLFRHDLHPIAQIVEKAVEHQSKQFIVFVHMKKTYDPVPHTVLWLALVNWMCVCVCVCVCVCGWVFVCGCVCCLFGWVGGWACVGVQLTHLVFAVRLPV